jgi:hypothetical protein
MCVHIFGLLPPQRRMNAGTFLLPNGVRNLLPASQRGWRGASLMAADRRPRESAAKHQSADEDGCSDADRIRAQSY